MWNIAPKSPKIMKFEKKLFKKNYSAEITQILTGTSLVYAY